MSTLPVGAVASLYADAQSLGAAHPSSKTEVASTAGIGFSRAMETAATRAYDTVAEAERMSIAAAEGKASTKDVVHAVVEAELTVQAIVTVRNKLVESYQEIMRMPI